MAILSLVCRGYTHRSGKVPGRDSDARRTAFIALVTAAITSSFVARATRRSEAARVQEELSDRVLMEKRCDELERKIEALALGRPGA